MTGEVNDHDDGQLVVEGSTTDGRIDTLATVSSNTSPIRQYTVTFPAGDYSTNARPVPNISSLNTFHVTVSPGSNIFVGDPVTSSGEDSQRVQSIDVLSCGTLGFGPAVPCVDINDYAGYGPLPAFTTINTTKYCLSNPNPPFDMCSSGTLSVYASFGPRFFQDLPPDQLFVLINPVTSIIRIESPSLVTNPCGNKCPFG